MDTTSTTTRSAETPLPELVAELGQLTASVNAIKARQVELVAAITHTHTVQTEDGTLLHLPMSDAYARLDAAALVAGSLGVSQQAAQHWVDRAGKLTGPLAPVHAAMADGVLDEARAKIICDELHEIPDEVAAVVAEHLMPKVRDGLSEDPSGESGVRLKRRVQTALAAVDPDAVKARAEKNRTDRCLRRWTSKAGVEEWLATLPATQSIRAWAAIDALAREFIKDGRSETLDQARADAMIALIEGQSTVSYVVTLGIPIPDHLAGDDPGAGPPNPSDPDPSDPEAVADPSEPGPADPDPGIRLEMTAPSPRRPQQRLATVPTTASGMPAEGAGPPLTSLTRATTALALARRMTPMARLTATGTPGMPTAGRLTPLTSHQPPPTPLNEVRGQGRAPSPSDLPSMRSRPEGRGLALWWRMRRRRRWTATATPTP